MGLPAGPATNAVAILDAGISDEECSTGEPLGGPVGRQACELTVITALFAFSWQLAVLAAVVAWAALSFAFMSGPPRRREAPAVGKTLSISLGVVVIMLGDMVCLVALMLFVLHGYQEDYDSGRANAIWFAVPTLALAVGLIGFGISVIRAARFPAEDEQGPIVTRV